MTRILFLFSFLALFSSQFQAQGIEFSQDTVYLGFGEYLDYQTVFVQNQSNKTVKLTCGIERVCRGDNTVPTMQVCFGDQCLFDQDSSMTWSLELLTLTSGESSGLLKLTETSNVNEGSHWRFHAMDSSDSTITSTINVYIAACGLSGSDDFEALEGFTVSPNPADSYLNLDLEGALINDLTFELYTSSGQAILKEVGASTINVEALPSGMYYYRAIVDNKAQFGKVSIN